jgi:hypothetical protein
MKNIWSVLCQESSVDSQTNKVSLFNCIEELTLGFPKKEDINADPKNIPMSFDIASLWLKDVNDSNNFRVSVDFCDPSDKILKSFEQNFSFEPGKKRLRTFIKVNGFIIVSEGTYKVRINYEQDNKTKLVSELPFDVIFTFQEKI